MKVTPLLLAACFGLIALPQSSFAYDDAEGELSVSATIAEECSLPSIGTLAFNSLGLLNNDQITSATVTVTVSY